MIDVEKEIFGIVSKAVREKYPKIFMTGEYVKSPSSFPCVYLVEVDNQIYRNTRTNECIENHVQVLYEVNVFSNLEQVLKQIALWMPEDTVVVSWSDNDLIQLQKEFETKNLAYLDFAKHFESWVDCQKTFSEKMHTEKVYRLSEALAITDIFYDENAHNALIDAQNTAELFIKMETEEELVLSPYYTSSINDIYDTSSSLLGSYTYA